MGVNKKETKQEMNEQLLRKVQAHILEEPMRANMNYWIERINNNDLRVQPLPIEFPACGTVGCIAGWAILLSEEGESEIDSNMVQAMMLLDLDSTDAGRLFFPDRWPFRLADQYIKADRVVDRDVPGGYQQRAKVISDRIDHFINTNGRE